jgi:hypothetical protein
MATERRFIITRSDLAETPIGAKHSLAEAEREAQYYADKDAEKVYIAWQSDAGQTICQPVEPRGTAEYLSTFAASDYETYSSYFLPIARRVEHLYKRQDREKVTQTMMPRAEAWASFAVIRHDRQLQKYYGHPIRFTTDTEREAARDMIAYILDELDAGNSWE